MSSVHILALSPCGRLGDSFGQMWEETIDMDWRYLRNFVGYIVSSGSKHLPGTDGGQERGSISDIIDRCRVEIEQYYVNVLQIGQILDVWIIC